MNEFDIIVTEVTDMHNDQVCVAGWERSTGRMVRPLAAPGKHWSARLAMPKLFEVGNVLRLRPSGEHGGRGVPHAREDTVLAESPALMDRVSAVLLPLELARSKSASVSGLFTGAVEGGRFVRAGTDCPSLGAVSLNPRRMGFEAKEKEDGAYQLRCWFYDAENQSYNLPVVSRSLNSTYRSGGVEELNALRTRNRLAHARLGLAHPFDDGRAFLMVNHVLFH